MRSRENYQFIKGVAVEMLLVLSVAVFGAMVFYISMLS